MQRILQEIIKKIILGTSDAWTTIHLSQQTSKPAYYILDWRIFDYADGQSGTKSATELLFSLESIFVPLSIDILIYVGHLIMQIWNYLKSAKKNVFYTKARAKWYGKLAGNSCFFLTTLAHSANLFGGTGIQKFC